MALANSLLQSGVGRHFKKLHALLGRQAQFSRQQQRHEKYSRRCGEVLSVILAKCVARSSSAVMAGVGNLSLNCWAMPISIGSKDAIVTETS